MMEKEEKQQMFTREEIAAFIEKDRDERLKRCLALITQAQEETGCKLIAVPVITQDGHISADVRIISAEQE